MACDSWSADFLLLGKTKKITAMSDRHIFLNDFHLIHEDKKHFSPERSIGLHEKALGWLKARLNEPFNGETVMVSRHLPSGQSAVERFKESLFSAYFASELSYLFGKMDLWIHGHTHDNLDYVVNRTRVIRSPFLLCQHPQV